MKKGLTLLLIIVCSAYCMNLTSLFNDIENGVLEDCVNCMRDPNTRWCSYDNDDISPACCYSDDTSFVCKQNTCSPYTGYQITDMIYCPQDTNVCGQQKFAVGSGNDPDINIKSDMIGDELLCWYRIYSNSDGDIGVEYKSSDTDAIELRFFTSYEYGKYLERDMDDNVYLETGETLYVVAKANSGTAGRINQLHLRVYYPGNNAAWIIIGVLGGCLVIAAIVSALWAYYSRKNKRALEQQQQANDIDEMDKDYYKKIDSKGDLDNSAPKRLTGTDAKNESGGLSRSKPREEISENEELQATTFGYGAPKHTKDNDDKLDSLTVTPVLNRNF